MKRDSLPCDDNDRQSGRLPPMPDGPPPPIRRASVLAFMLWVFDLLALWHIRSKGRRRVLALDDRMLDDIGRSRCDAEREARKWFWQP